MLITTINDFKVKPKTRTVKHEKQNHTNMINDFKITNLNMQVLLGYPPPVFTYTDWNNNISNGVIAGVNTALGETNAQLMDFNTPMQSLEPLFPDNVHPTAEGYAVMAGIAHNRLVATNLISSLLPRNPSYEENEIVALTATPDAGYLFVGWSGDLSGTSNPVTINMDTDKTVIATFSLQTEIVFLDGFESN